MEVLGPVLWPCGSVARNVNVGGNVHGGIGGSILSCIGCEVLVSEHSNFLITLLLGAGSSLKKCFHVDSEFDCVSSRSGSQIVLSGFESFFPAIEMHGCHLFMLRVWHVEIE